MNAAPSNRHSKRASSPAENSKVADVAFVGSSGRAPIDVSGAVRSIVQPYTAGCAVGVPGPVDRPHLDHVATLRKTLVGLRRRAGDEWRGVERALERRLLVRREGELRG